MRMGWRSTLKYHTLVVQLTQNSVLETRWNLYWNCVRGIPDWMFFTLLSFSLLIVHWSKSTVEVVSINNFLTRWLLLKRDFSFSIPKLLSPILRLIGRTYYPLIYLVLSLHHKEPLSFPDDLQSIVCDSRRKVWDLSLYLFSTHVQRDRLS